MLCSSKTIVLFPIVACLFVSTSHIGAQDYVLDELYGNGVHYFFSHDYQEAVENLTLAITEGRTDPRVFYFRGLAQIRKGLQEEGEEDFRTGARYEASDSAGYMVGRSLERIQGPTRLLLEKYRREARIEFRRQRILRDRLRYDTPQDPADINQPPTNLPDDSVTDPFTDKTEDRPIGTGPVEDVTETLIKEEPDAMDFGEPETEVGEMENEDMDDADIFGETDSGDSDDSEDPFGADESEDEDMSDEDDDPFAVDDPFGE